MFDGVDSAASRWLIYTYSYADITQGLKRARQVAEVDASDALGAIEKGKLIVNSRQKRKPLIGIEARSTRAPSITAMLNRLIRQGKPDADNAWREFHRRRRVMRGGHIDDSQYVTVPTTDTLLMVEDIKGLGIF